MSVQWPKATMIVHRLRSSLRHLGQGLRPHWCAHDVVLICQELTWAEGESNSSLSHRYPAIKSYHATFEVRLPVWGLQLNPLPPLSKAK